MCQLAERLAAEASDAPQQTLLPEVRRQADDLISIRQLRARVAEAAGAIELDDDDDIALSKACRKIQNKSGTTEAWRCSCSGSQCHPWQATGALAVEDFSQRLKRVTQLTGLSDPVYAEAYVTVHSYDILLDLLIINQTQVRARSNSLLLRCRGSNLCVWVPGAGAYA